MRRLILTAFWMLSCFTIKAQYNLVVDSKFQPLSYEQLMMVAQAQAARNAYNSQKYDEYIDSAYKYLGKGDDKNFIYYTNMALSTGFYSAKVYYDRGVVFERLHDYKSAKKEYKKAKKKGYYQAGATLEQCKKREKAWCSCLNLVDFF